MLDFDPDARPGASTQAQASDAHGRRTLRSQSVQRVNYDSSINGRLMVFGQGGNDFFAVDDNAATTTLDGGAGNDTFQIGQIYGLQRDGSQPTNRAGRQHARRIDRHALRPVPATRQFADAAEHLRHGGDDARLAQRRRDFAAGRRGRHRRRHVHRLQQPGRRCVSKATTATTCLRCARSRWPQTDPITGEIVWIDPVQEIAQPKLTKGFSTAAETDIRTGAGNNQVEYNINAPVSVDGGSGFDKLVVLGTEFADHIVVTDKGIFGAGLTVTYENIEVLEVDALEGDDTIDVLSTAPGMAVRVIGGLGNDTINVAGDVAGDVVSRDINGTSSTINHRITSDDPPTTAWSPTASR